MALKGSRRQAVIVAVSGCLLAGLLALTDGKNKMAGSVGRQEPGKGSQEQEYILNAGEVLEDYSWTVTAEERKLTETEREEVLKKAQKELEQKILGENKSLEEISKDLYLPETLQDGVVQVEYGLSDYSIFYPDGTIRELPEKTVVVTVSAEMECQGEMSVYEFAIQAVPPEKSRGELLVEEIQAALDRENGEAGEKELELPKEVDGVSLSWEKKAENRSVFVAVLGFIAAGCILASEKEKRKKVQKEREQQMLRDYPDILDKLILLMGAGMNVAMAWKRIVESYQKRKEEQKLSERPAYEEMVTAVYEMQEGIGEVQAYKNFGERCALQEYRKLSAILVQNVRKGSMQIQEILEEEKIEAYEKQKARVKIAGEEAGTKLLLPMVLMLLVVLVIIMVPAMMSMNL